MKTLHVGNIDTLREKLWSLDLEPIMAKLMDHKEGEGWSYDQAMSGIEEYRRYLFLTMTRPETMVPTKFIDTVWHAHILDTAKYREDCQAIFGFFLDHFPYFGMRGDEDRSALLASFDLTARVYEAVFGSPYNVKRGLTVAQCGEGTCGGDGVDCGNNACGQCGGSGITGYADVMHPNIRPTLSM